MTSSHTTSDRNDKPPVRILYVEGDSFVSQVPNRFLVSCGCDVTVAHSVGAAWCHCEAASAPFDIVIADGDTPAMGGLELVSKLQSVGYPGHIIVFLASMEDALVGRYEQLGVKGILRKPLALSDLSEFLEAIAQHLPGGGLVK